MTQIGMVEVTKDEDIEVYDIKVGNLKLTVWANHDMIHISNVKGDNIAGRRISRNIASSFWINP